MEQIIKVSGEDIVKAIGTAIQNILYSDNSELLKHHAIDSLVEMIPVKMNTMISGNQFVYNKGKKNV